MYEKVAEHHLEIITDTYSAVEAESIPLCWHRPIFRILQDWWKDLSFSGKLFTKPKGASQGSIIRCYLFRVLYATTLFIHLLAIKPWEGLFILISFSLASRSTLEQCHFICISVEDTGWEWLLFTHEHCPLVGENK